MEHRQIYDTEAWHKVRNAYKKQAKGLCERCLKNGIIKTGEIVHHKIYINDENQNDPEIVFNFNNLELLCRNCHAEEHRKNKRRFSIDENGVVILHQEG